jgi:hypothetical protein
MVKKKTPERRIIVTIDISAQPNPAIALAAALAKARKRELHGLFIEDTELLNVARLPFTREFPRFGGQSRELSDMDLERNMARMAERYRAELARQATEHALSWSYSSERTSKRQLTRIASGDTDLLIISQPNRENGARMPRILLLDADRASVLQALDTVLEAAAYDEVEILVHGEFAAATLNDVLNSYPGTTRRLMGAPSLEELLTNPRYRPSLVLLARNAEAAELDSCLRLADCPVVLAT